MKTGRLLVISHTAHYRRGEAVAAWGPTTREIDRLAGLFQEVTHLAPLHAGEGPPSALPYEARNVRHAFVPVSGGTGLASKLGVLRAWRLYLRTILRELDRCDTVHVRCPSNIGLLAVLVLWRRREPRRRWIKYAGNWRQPAGENWSYALQRWLLSRGAARALVTVNGQWPDQPAHVRSFLNPCLTEGELTEGAAIGAGKQLALPLRLLFVGRLEDEKGCGRAIEILAKLRRRGVQATLDLVGDGAERPRFEAQAARAGLGQEVRFRGWLPRQQLASVYGEAHIFLFPSSASEGWPKVVSEAMAYGVVPVTSDVRSLPHYMEAFGVGRALDASDTEAFVEAIAGYLTAGDRWKRESRKAIGSAARFSYGEYLVAVRALLGLEAA
jgi:glycosyltransferase involved in cell wall biosynthesis